MNRNKIYFLFFMFQWLFGQAAYALSISNVSHYPVADSKTSFTIQYRLSEPANIILNIYDDRNILIKFVTKSKLNINSGEVIWNGTDTNGIAVPPEAYHYTLLAQVNGDSVLYDPTDITGNKFVNLQNIKWNKEHKTVSYTINKPARVSIRVGIDKGGPLLASVINWVPRKNGKHVEKWDGMDTQAKIDVSNIKNTILHARAYSLSVNTILIGNNISKSTYVEKIDWPIKKRIVSSENNKMFNFMIKDADARNDYAIGLTLPKLNKSSFYTGKIPIKITLDSKNTDRLLQDRFEPMLFVDGVFYTELETGFFPLTWKLDTTKFDNGKHFITVNLRGYDGQFGVASATLKIRN